jgi:hypothetical protein
MKAGAVEIAGPGSGSTVGLASGELSLSSRDHLPFLVCLEGSKDGEKEKGLRLAAVHNQRLLLLPIGGGCGFPLDLWLRSLIESVMKKWLFLD